MSVPTFLDESHYETLSFNIKDTQKKDDVRLGHKLSLAAAVDIALWRTGRHYTLKLKMTKSQTRNKLQEEQSSVLKPGNKEWQRGMQRRSQTIQITVLEY